MSETAICLIIFFSALSGALIGIIVYQILEAKRANNISKNGGQIRGQNFGHSGGRASGREVFCSGESWVVFPLDAERNRLDSDRYARKD
jgi:hypothetical protein